MRVIGQSATITKIPYLHLAYVATSSIKPHSPTFAVGGILLTLGILALLIIEYIKNIDSSFKFSFKFISTIAVILGLAFITISMAVWGTRQLDHPDFLMKSKFNRITRWANDSIVNKGKTYEEFLKIYKEDLIDVWNKKLKIVKANTNNGVTYTFISAGADGKFNTKDDFKSAPFLIEEKDQDKLKNTSIKTEKKKQK
ncbi:hypothetical protein AAEX28_07545 [Lentisphaerota bacterium WC36G]|nr:hypothetical protein LJT99_10405 [Lentisphaerae bacterium WC36]